MSRYDLYGVHADDVRDARVKVESALGIRMVPHESSYRGGEYFRIGNVDNENFILQSNYDSGEDEWAEPMHTNYPVLLYVSETDRDLEIADALNGIGELLRTEEL